MGAVMLVLYAGLVGLAGFQFARAPTGFITNQDLGYLLNIIQLPPGASLARTDAVVREATKIVLDTPGVGSRRAVRGLRRHHRHQRVVRRHRVRPAQAVRRTRRPGPDRRAHPGRPASPPVRYQGRRSSSRYRPRRCAASGPPVGSRCMSRTSAAVARRRWKPRRRTSCRPPTRRPAAIGVFTLFNTRTPKVYADIDRARAQILGVPASRIFEALQVYLGSAYVNDFNILGRTYEVMAQADEQFRRDPHDIANLKTRNNAGQMVPHRRGDEPARHHRRLPRAALQPFPGRRSPGQHPARHTRPATALDTMERWPPSVCRTASASNGRTSPIQQKLAGNTILLIFAASALVRLPGAGRAIRKLDVAAGHHPDRADVPAGRRDRAC